MPEEDCLVLFQRTLINVPDIIHDELMNSLSESGCQLPGNNAQCTIFLPGFFLFLLGIVEKRLICSIVMFNQIYKQIE